MKKINFILLFSFLFSFYNFNSEDWVFISEPDIINSITEDSFYIYFLANNGIYSYDKMNEDFFYNIDLSYNLVDEEKYYIHYHKSTDYFFIFTQNYILSKSSVSSRWKKYPLSSFNIHSFYSIEQIGFSDNNLYLELYSGYIQIDLFTMNSINLGEIDNIGDIYWLFYNASDLDLSNYYTLDNSLINSNSIEDISDSEHFVTSYMLDRNENLWIGMDSGAIYQVDDFSYNIERIDAGPRVKYVSGLYNDDKYNWYFFDNYFRRTGNYSYQNNGYFLSIWNEKDNDWIHIPKNETILINNAIINNIYRLDDYILFLTMDGLIIYSLRSNDWYQQHNFYNNQALWMVEEYNKKLYFASSDGLIVANYQIIDNKLQLYLDEILLNDIEVYDISFPFISSKEGLYEINNNSMFLINPDTYFNIEKYKKINNPNKYFVLALDFNNRLWRVKDNDKKHNSNSFIRKRIGNNIDNFCYIDNKIFAVDYNRIKMISDHKEWVFDLSQLNVNGPIYSIDCDNEWLWFTHSKGIAFFKWINYYAN
tara:strand:+ start:1052 stop:2656 length:1605 start_codon:yes stop_codon:yes gene_type:complete